MEQHIHRIPDCEQKLSTALYGGFMVVCDSPFFVVSHCTCDEMWAFYYNTINMRKWVSAGERDRMANQRTAFGISIFLPLAHFLRLSILVSIILRVPFASLHVRHYGTWSIAILFVIVCRMLPRWSSQFMSQGENTWFRSPFSCATARRWNIYVDGADAWLHHNTNRYRHTILIWWFAINFNMHKANHKMGIFAQVFYRSSTQTKSFRPCIPIHLFARRRTLWAMKLNQTRAIFGRDNYLNSHNHKSFIHRKSFKWQFQLQNEDRQQFKL